MPQKIGAGKKPEEYDPNTGKYCCAGISKVYTKAILLMEQFSVTEDRKKTSKIVPNYYKSVTPDEKFVNYSLDKSHVDGRNKAIVYEKALGFTKDNFKLLKNQIHSKIICGKAPLVSIQKSFNGIKYRFEIEVTGVNKKTAIVVAVYMIDKKSSFPRMITNYVK